MKQVDQDHKEECMPKMKLRSLNELLELPFFNVYSAEYVNTEYEKVKNYELVSRNHTLTADTLGKELGANAVAILAVDEENEKVLLTREFRMPINDYVTGIPAGLIDPGEDARQAAIRELKEETGYIADRVIILPPAFSCIGLTDESASAVFVTVKGRGETAQEENEEITSDWYSYDEAIRIMTDPKVRTGARAQLMVLMWLALKGYPVLERI